VRPEGVIMRGIVQFVILAACLLLLVPFTLAGEGRQIKKSPLDYVILYESLISKDAPIRIREFPTDNADLGTGAKKNKPKYQELAREMKEKAPKLVLQAAIDGLQEEGFKDVAPAEEDATIPDGALIIEGEFTKLNPGSKGKRYGIGFGAGKSQICASGKVVRGAQGDVLMGFDHCRIGSGGWFGGDSESLMSKDSRGTGSHLAEFMGKWAEGKYAP
jgi:hypothetical protein